MVSSQFERGSILGRRRAPIAALGSDKAAATATESVAYSFLQSRGSTGNKPTEVATESNELR